MTKDQLIAVLREKHTQRTKLQRQLLNSGRGYTVTNDSELELTLEEWLAYGSSTRSEETLQRLIDEETQKYNALIRRF